MATAAANTDTIDNESIIESARIDDPANESATGSYDSPISTDDSAASGAATSGDGTSRKRKRSGTSGDGAGTERLSRSKPAQTAKRGAGISLDQSGRKVIAANVTAAHKAFALWRRNPLWAITDKNGEDITDAVLDVFDQYKIKIDPKTVCWLNLLGVASAIYAPRITATIAVTRMQAAQAKAGVQAPPPVVDPTQAYQSDAVKFEE